MAKCNRCGYENPDDAVACLNCYYEVGVPYDLSNAKVPLKKVKPLHLTIGGLCLVGILGACLGLRLSSGSSNPNMDAGLPTPSSSNTSSTYNPGNATPTSNNPNIPTTQVPQQTASATPAASEYPLSQPQTNLQPPHTPMSSISETQNNSTVDDGNARREKEKQIGVAKAQEMVAYLQGLLARQQEKLSHDQTRLQQGVGSQADIDRDTEDITTTRNDLAAAQRDLADAQAN